MRGWGNQKEEEGGDEKKQECEQNPVCWCAQKQIDLCETFGFLSKQGKVFHEAVAPYRLAFSSLTQGPAPVPAQAGGARARSPRCPGSAARKGPGRGASARTWLQPPARTPRRRALLAEGPSAALGRPAAKQR